jgi:peptidoglycan hydrolase-like protein with peptidoglycan-binding domain
VERLPQPRRFVRFTTGGDYGQDLIERLAAIAAELGQDSGGGVPAQLLEIGVRGPAVTQLKSDLQVWFDVSEPGEWETFGVDSSNAFGPALAKAVRVFQQRSDLAVDGQVGPNPGRYQRRRGERPPQQGRAEVSRTASR